MWSFWRFDDKPFCVFCAFCGCLSAQTGPKQHHARGSCPTDDLNVPTDRAEGDVEASKDSYEFSFARIGGRGVLFLWAPMRRE